MIQIQSLRRLDPTRLNPRAVKCVVSANDIVLQLTPANYNLPRRRASRVNSVNLHLASVQISVAISIGKHGIFSYVPPQLRNRIIAGEFVRRRSQIRQWSLMAPDSAAYCSWHFVSPGFGRLIFIKASCKKLCRHCHFIFYASIITFYIFHD